MPDLWQGHCEQRGGAALAAPEEHDGGGATAAESVLLRGGRKYRITYKSSYRTFDPDYQETYDGYAGNAMARVHYWKHGDVGRPTAICIHPWCLGNLTVAEHLFGVCHGG